MPVALPASARGEWLVAPKLYVPIDTGCAISARCTSCPLPECLWEQQSDDEDTEARTDRARQRLIGAHRGASNPEQGP
jgi:hypothetical protein